jgi:Na+/H+ antiporter NhaD/arsenite permease-like protein
MFETLLIAVFVLGYVAITLEHVLDVNKAGVALLMAVICWIVMQTVGHHEGALDHLSEHLAEISQIILFLLGAMTIVELVSEYRGFDVLQRRIAEGGVNTVLWVMPFFTFFMSAVLDNVTTTILMLSILRPLIPKQEVRWKLAGIVVLTANAGGAWSPIGDVTTTMLWIDDRVSSMSLITHVLVPSIVCAVVPIVIMAPGIRRDMAGMHPELQATKPVPFSGTILTLGVSLLLFVPVLKVLTGLPPYAGMLLGLGVLWVVTDVIDTAAHLKVPHVLGKIDISSVLFFLGILLAVAALESAGLLGEAATYLDATIGDQNIILTLFGLLSSVVDNVPLTAAVMGMYDVTTYPVDTPVWHLTAFCAGTGGSILVIGSAAGVVAMGMEHISFFWWLRRIGFLALVGYLAGVASFLAFNGTVG